jgi:hypothetical protein
MGGTGWSTYPVHLFLEGSLGYDYGRTYQEVCEQALFGFV